MATKRKIATSKPDPPTEDLNIAEFKIRVRDNLFDNERRERVKNILVPASSKRVVQKPKTCGDYVSPVLPSKVRKVEKKSPVKLFTCISPIFVTTNTIKQRFSTCDGRDLLRWYAKLRILVCFKALEEFYIRVQCKSEKIKIVLKCVIICTICFELVKYLKYCTFTIQK